MFKHHFEQLLVPMSHFHNFKWLTQVRGQLPVNMGRHCVTPLLNIVDGKYEQSLVGPDVIGLPSYQKTSPFPNYDLMSYPLINVNNVSFQQMTSLSSAMKKKVNIQEKQFSSTGKAILAFLKKPIAVILQDKLHRTYYVKNSLF